MALTSTLELVLAISQTQPKDLSTPTDAFTKRIPKELASGVAVDQADLVFHDTRTLAGTSESLDLTAVLLDKFGASLTFAKITTMLFHNLGTGVADILSVGGDVAGLVNWVGDVTDIVKIGPGAYFFINDPSLAAFGVTATTADIIKVENSTTFDYEVILIGRSS